MGNSRGLTESDRLVQAVADPVESPRDPLIHRGRLNCLPCKQSNDLLGALDQDIIIIDAIAKGSQKIARAQEHNGVVDRRQVSLAIAAEQCSPGDRLRLDEDHDDVLATPVKLVPPVRHDD
jgi:hypothetical protein